MYGTWLWLTRISYYENASLKSFINRYRSDPPSNSNIDAVIRRYREGLTICLYKTKAPSFSYKTEKAQNRWLVGPGSGIILIILRFLPLITASSLGETTNHLGIYLWTKAHSNYNWKSRKEHPTLLSLHTEITRCPYSEDQGLVFSPRGVYCDC